MSGHTPGPWKFQASPAHGYRIRTTESGPRLTFGSGDVAVVFFAGNGRSQEQCKADAKLIAAAPLLYEALTKLCAQFPTDIDMAEAGWGRTEINEACDAYDAARAALASTQS